MVKRAIFALYFLIASIVLVSALVDITFDTGFGYSWRTVRDSAGLIAFGSVIYLVTGWMHRAMFGD